MPEMKEKMWEIQKFFGAESVEDLPAKLLETVLGDNCKKILDEYLDLAGNLETDFCKRGISFIFPTEEKGQSNKTSHRRLSLNFAGGWQSVRLKG